MFECANNWLNFIAIVIISVHMNNHQNCSVDLNCIDTLLQPFILHVLQFTCFVVSVYACVHVFTSCAKGRFRYFIATLYCIIATGI